MSGIRRQIMVGDATERLQDVPDECIDMVLTSPPYFRLRNYAVSGQIGLEAHVDDWVKHLQAVCRQLHRVLLPSGSLWLNLGDTYARHPKQGADPKSLLLAPERVALALLGDGWLLRNKIVWHKPNHIPSSVRDRLTNGWEVLYLFTKQPRYYFNLDPIRQPQTSGPRSRLKSDYQRPPREAWRGPNGGDASGLDLLKARGIVGHPLGKNPGDVWQIASSNYRGAHRATFPIAFAIQAIRAGCPPARCVRCRTAWHPRSSRLVDGQVVLGAAAPTCDCQVPSEPAIVLDPFFGAGTTAVAAERLGRDWLGIELNPDFAELARRRIQAARAGPAKPAG